MFLFILNMYIICENIENYNFNLNISIFILSCQIVMNMPRVMKIETQKFVNC